MLEERNCSFYALNSEFGQRAIQSCDSLLPVPTTRDEFRDKRIVVGWNSIPSVEISINPDTNATRGVVSRHQSWRRHKLIGGVFSINPAFNRVSTYLNIRLVIPEWISHSESNLFLNQINTRNALGDSMFNLNTRVHLQEIVIIVFIDNKLNSASVRVTDGFRGFRGGFTDFGTKFRWNRGSGCFF